MDNCKIKDQGDSYSTTYASTPFSLRKSSSAFIGKIASHPCAFFEKIYCAMASQNQVGGEPPSLELFYSQVVSRHPLPSTSSYLNLSFVLQKCYSNTKREGIKVLHFLPNLYLNLTIT